MALGPWRSRASACPCLSGCLSRPDGRFDFPLRQAQSTARLGQNVRTPLPSFRSSDTRIRCGRWCLVASLLVFATAWYPAPHSEALQFYQLRLARARHLVAPFRVTAEDLELQLKQGCGLIAVADGQPTALVLVGQGSMRFAPPVPSERRQVQLFTGSPVLTTGFDAAYIRLHPSDFPSRVEPIVWSEAPAPDGLLRQGERIFRDEVARSYVAELGAPGTPPASVLPPPGDFLAEIHTTRLGRLTFARVASQPEDIVLADATHDRQIAVYPSAAHRRAFGFDYGDEYGLPYKATHYDVDVSVDPRQQQMSGRAHLRLESVAALETLSLRLDPGLQVTRVSSDQQGPHEFRQQRGSDTLLVRVSPPLPAGRVLDLQVAFQGWPKPQPLVGERSVGLDDGYVLFSNLVYWFPQSPVRNHATVTLRVAVPSGLAVVASGVAQPAGPSDRAGPQQRYAFRTVEPVRYLSLLVGELVPVDLEPAGDDREPAQVFASSDLVEEARAARRQVADIIGYFSSLFGTLPFAPLTLVVVQAPVPAGHSPAHLVILGEPRRGNLDRGADNPSQFGKAPEFLLAHEVAHQWWGQAVGWRNYREQWLSEAFAQYSAALYVRHVRGGEAFGEVLAWMRRWALSARGHGPIDLGLRAGKITNRQADFPAIVYDRGALVLHMLRGLLGDNAFFDGLRCYRRRWAFHRAGTDDFRRALQDVSGRDLTQFFDQWIRDDGWPELQWSAVVESQPPRVRITVEQTGPAFELPLQMAIEYQDRPTATHPLRVVGPRQEWTFPLDGRLRRVRLDDDPGVLCLLRERR